MVANSLAELDGKIGDTASRAEAHKQTLDARISRERGEVEEMLALQRGALEHCIGLMEQRNNELEQRLAQAEAFGQQVVAMTASRSWRITAPLRAAGSFARRVRNALRKGRLISAIKRRVRGVMRRIGQWLLRNRGAKRAVKAMLAPFPRLRGIVVDALLEAAVPVDAGQSQDDKLSPRSRQLYSQLQQAFKQKISNAHRD